MVLSLLGYRLIDELLEIIYIYIRLWLNFNARIPEIANLTGRKNIK